MTDAKDDEMEVELLELPKAEMRCVFTLEDNQRVLADCEVPSVSEVARRHGISPSLLVRWRL